MITTFIMVQNHTIILVRRLQMSGSESVDTTIRPSRNADGTIDMHNLLVIKSGVLSDNVGARLDTTSEEAISVKPQAGEVVSHVFEWTTTKEANMYRKG